MGGTSNDSSSCSMSPASSPSSISSSIVFLDLYGKRRQVAKVQVLEREIGLLQDEIKSLAELELASRCCKELDDYVEATSDPLIALNQSRGRSKSVWKNIRKKVGSIICCCCCNTIVHCSCCPQATDCCWGGQQKSCTSKCCCWGDQQKSCTSKCCKCPEISYHCSCYPSCPKCSVCCCCNPCSCF